MIHRMLSSRRAVDALLVVCAVVLAVLLVHSLQDGLVVTALLVGCGLAFVIVLSGAVNVVPEDTRSEGHGANAARLPRTPSRTCAAASLHALSQSPAPSAPFFCPRRARRALR